VLSLSLAIAATAMGLSAYNALLVRPPAVTDPGSLQLIHIRTPSEPFGAASFPEYADFRAHTRAFADIAAFPYAISSLAFTAADRREQVIATQVSTNFFGVLGIQAKIGLLAFRTSSADDIDDIVIGDALWRKLGANRDLIGQTVRLNDHPVTAIHSLFNLRHVSLGFSARNLVFAGVDMRRSGFDERTGPAFYERVRDRLIATTGIQAVALAGDPPMLGYATDHVVAEGDPPPADGHGAPTPYAVVDDRYFPTLGIGLLAGRMFDARDRASRTEVIVVNAMLARRHWPGRDPVGRRLRIENGNRLVEVIGVVPDGKYGEIDEQPLPFMYFALAQHYLPDVTVIARTDGPRDSVARALQEMHPNVVFGGIGSAMTLDDVLRLSLLLPETIVWTTLIFGALAVALAVFGLYSMVFYAVTQRRTEIGIRTTLGATPIHVFALVFKESGWVALLGGGIGLAAGLALLPFASSLFYGIGAVEPGVLAVVALVSTGIALMTTYLVVRPWTRLTALDLLRR
jgi:putative ABC transport system permease protein